MVRLAADMGIFQAMSMSEHPVNDIDIAEQIKVDPALVCKYDCLRPKS